MSAELLPCPFCGAKVATEDQFGNEWWVQCTDLDCGRSDGRIYDTPAEAIAAWNRRAATPTGRTE